MDKYISQELIKAALGQIPADIVIRNGKLINVYTSEIYLADVAISGARIAAIGNVDYCIGDNTKIIDATGLYLSPGLIDSHIHPEASKITTTQFANAVISRGTTSIMCPLDHTAVVAGREGVRFTLDEIGKTHLKAFHSSPSRLPYTTPASTIAHNFTIEDHKITQKWPEANGIWEYMASDIEDMNQEVLDVANLTIQNGLFPHGHMPTTSGKIVSACAAAGTRDDHESYTAEEMMWKISNGIYGLIRRGTHLNNLPELVKALTEHKIPSKYLAFCTDDLDCLDIRDFGLIDYLVREAIRLGVDPITAIQMGSINAAECYRVDLYVGSITPGRFADILLIDDLSAFSINSVIASGVVIVDNKNIVHSTKSPKYPDYFYNTCRLNKPIETSDLLYKLDQDAEKVDVLCIHLNLDDGLISQGKVVSLQVENRVVSCDPENGINFISVIDRHTGKGKTAKGFISGMNITKGAIATSLSPDDHNIICVGANVEDMTTAIIQLVSMGGGQIAVNDGVVLASIPLPIAGEMDDISVEEMAQKEEKLNEAAHFLGSKIKRPFFYLMFLSITAIPNYAMTDAGLVEFASRSVIDPILKVYGE